MNSPKLNTTVTRSSLRVGTALTLLLLAHTAYAQSQSAPADASVDSPPPAPQTSGESRNNSADSAAALREIIVTGTLIRGIAPAGSSSLGLGRSEITATGATTTTQLLASIPQLGTFNSMPSVSGGVATASVNRVTLRSLPGTGGGSSTLLLVDGHRMPGMGILQTIPDPDAIPPGAIERVEVVPDGGSSTYGADAVGGVVNFITRRRYNGFEAGGKVGFADNISTRNAHVTAGKAWDQYSVWVAYDYESHGSLYGRDRSYVQRRDYINDLPLDLTCAPGNVLVGSTTYALPSLTAGNGNRCDISKNQTIYPSEEKHSVMAGISYGNGGPVTFDLRGFYTNRLNVSDNGPFTGTVQVSAGNPYYQSVGGTNATASQTVYYNFANATGNSAKLLGRLETWQISPSLTAKLSGDWELRALATYGSGVNTSQSKALDTGALQTLVSSGLFNPYDPAASVNKTYYSALTNYGETGYGRNDQADAKITFDGPLFSLPGGQVRVAVGGEYLYEKYTGFDYTGSFSSVPAAGSAHRHVSAAFGEVQIPIVGSTNRLTVVQALNLSLSGRYDHYSDFGGTFNPRLGLTYKPVDWVSLRGSWSKSFQAPSLADTNAAASNSIIVLPFVAFPAPGVTPKAGQAQIFLSGGGANLRPQKANIFSFGGDIKPPFLEGLRLGGTYYNIKFKDLIGIPPVYNPTTYYALYPQLYTLNPTAAQVKAFAAQASGGASAVAPYTISDGQVYVIQDGRRTNQSAVNVSGVDFSVNYVKPTGFGTVYLNFNGNYVLSRKEQTVAGAAVVNTVDNYTRLSLATTVGTTVGGLKAQATWNRSDGVKVSPTTATLNQTQVDPLNLVNVFVSYDFKREGALKDTSLQLNINNIFNTSPPRYNQGNGYPNFSTLGRFFEIGFNKKF